MNLSSWEIGYEPRQYSPCHLLGQRYPKAALMYIPSDILGSKNYITLGVAALVKRSSKAGQKSVIPRSPLEFQSSGKS